MITLAIADEGHLAGTEPLGRLAHLRQERLRIARVARENLDRQRNALLVAQQADHDLLLASLAVAVVAEGGQLVVRPLQVTAGHVVEKQFWPALLVRLAGLKQSPFDVRLPLAQPVKVCVQMFLVKAARWLQATPKPIIHYVFELEPVPRESRWAAPE